MRLGNLRVFGRLDRYVGALFISAYATAFLLVVGLRVVIDVATNLSFFEAGEDGQGASISMLAEYYALNTPFMFAQVSPFVTVVAAMFTVSRLVKKNEFSAGLSAGVSAQRLLASVFIGALLATGATFAIREYATLKIGARCDALFDRMYKHRDEAVLKNFFFRDIAGNVVRLNEYRAGNLEGKVPEGDGLAATLTRGGNLVRVLAEHFTWVNLGPRRGWKLEGGSVRLVGDASSVQKIDWLDVVDFTPSDVLTAAKARVRPLELSFSQVLDMSRRDPDNTSYQTLLQYLLTFPMANIVLVLCAIPFLVGRERGKAGEAVTGGLLLCVAFFCIDFVSRSMGMSGDLSPLISAWLPVLIFGALGISLTHFMRT